MHVPSWFHWKDIASATAVAIELAVVATIIGALQLCYSRKRDRAVDRRNDWEKVHKAMIDFRLHRELLNTLVGKMPGELIHDAYISLHQLKGQLDRVDDPLVGDIIDYLDQNWDPKKWRSPEFLPEYDKFAKQAALRSR
jgi:hypothetical protein